MVQNVNLSVIGAGYWGKKVTKEYLQLALSDHRFRLAKICDVEKKKLSYFKNVMHMNTENLASDYEAVLKDPNINAVHICTPNATHYKIGLQALQMGKNVLLEKPIATSQRDAWNLCDVAESAHLCLQVGHIYRFNNALKKIKNLISEGYFGKLYYLKLQWTTWVPSPLGRDIILDLGPHPIDILHFLLNKWPFKVSCTAKAYRRSSLEEVAYFNLDFDDRVMAHVELSWLQPGKVRKLTVIGKQRAATVDCLKQTIQVFEDNNGNNFPLQVCENNTILDEIIHFVTSIRDESNHKNPGSVGAGNIAVLESLKRSLLEERSVKVGLSN